jgi:hypothetical protein
VEGLSMFALELLAALACLGGPPPGPILVPGPGLRLPRPLEERVEIRITEARDRGAPPRVLLREVSLPTSALVETAGGFFVFVQPTPLRPVYLRRRVDVVRRAEGQAHVRAQLTVEQRRRGLQPVLPGERVVTTGALYLSAALDDLLIEEVP